MALPTLQDEEHLLRRGTAVILTCTCKHAFQDALYGPGKRVHNFSKKKDVQRCTVCSREK
jgi:hypothetical protein